MIFSKKEKILFFSLLFAISLPIYGQMYTVPSSGFTSYTVCSGTLYDANGTSNYGKYYSGYAILYPSTPGHFIRVSGTIAGETCCDYLYIYDGAGTGGTLLWHGVASSGTVPVVTSTTGPLTVRFTSDGSVTGQGFELNISCCDHCSCAIENANLSIINSGTDFITISWTGSSSVPNYIVEYGPAGFTPGTGQQVSTTSTTYTITGLREGQNYDIYVYFDCDNDGSITGDTYANFTYSHTNCIDFSNFNAPGVVCTYGTTSNPFSNTGVVDGRHTIMTGGTDPYTYGQLPCVPPGGVNSVRLGNSSVGAQAESITYTYSVDTNINEILILRYAAVLQNPGHSYSQQPRFIFKILNAAGIEIDPLCCSADFVSGNTTQGWQSGSSSTLWKPWTNVGIDVSPYHGQNIRVQLVTYDCSPTAHFGYAYFTLECGGKKRLTVESCGDATEITYTAPRGFNYRWYLSTNPSQTISTNQSVTVTTNSNATLYCDVSFIDNVNCKFTLSTVVTPRYPYADFIYNRLGCDYTYDFINYSTISDDGIVPNTSGEPCETYYWDFGNGETSTEENPTITYDAPGTYTVRLIAGITNDMCQDTIEKTITIIPFAPYIVGDTVSCEGENNVLTIMDGTAYLWDTGETTPSINVAPTTTTTYSATVTHVDGCTETVEHTILVHPTFNSSITASICQGESYLENGFSLQNVRTVGMNTFVLPLTTEHGCDSIVTLHLEVKPLPVVELGNDITVCFDQEGNPYLDAGRDFDTYSWSNGLNTRMIQVTDTGLYSILVTLNGCKAKDSIRVNNLCPFQLYVPNTITAYLADGTNDYFYLPNTEKIKELEIHIYDRWGQLVFESKDMNFRWDGTVYGTITPNTIYNYQLFIISDDGKKHVFKGHITVL